MSANDPADNPALSSAGSAAATGAAPASQYSALGTQHSALALWWTAPRTGELRAEPLTPPGPDDVIVQAVASGISAGTELLVYRGQVPPELPLDLDTLAGSFRYPIKYGYASVGRVAAVGAAVRDRAAGDLVFALHPHQTAYVLPAARTVPLPRDLPPEHGVFLANLETAVNVALDAAPRLGETVLLSGLGVVGLLVLQTLRRAGAAEIIAVDALPRRRALAARLGAAVTLAPDADVVAEVMARTAGRGADLAVEVSGAPAALGTAIEAVADEGTVVVASWYGTKPAPLQLGSHFHRGRVRIRSSQVGHLDPALAPRWDYARRLAVAQRLLVDLPLGDLISHRFPFAQALDAFALLDHHPADALQVVLTYE
jgi:2-desacetyl-2-hydroxyethyl bacteriochlorophyllide A dehydrogenase